MMEIEKEKRAEKYVSRARKNKECQEIHEDHGSNNVGLKREETSIR